MNQDAPAIRRATFTLLLTQSLASAALITSTTVNPLVMAQLSGQDVLAGLPSAIMLGGASLAAYPAGRLMGRIGRRSGLLIGCAVGIVGALIIAGSVIAAWVPVYMIGLLIMGAGRGTLDQGRYAAADINPPEHRARALSIVIFGGTVGAVVGPALVAPSSQVMASLGLAQLSGPFIATGLILAIAGIVVAVMLRMDLKGIAQRTATRAADAHALANVGIAHDAIQPRTAQSVLDLLRFPEPRLAVITLTCAQAAMVMMMAIISLHMTHHDHGLGDVSLVTSAHVLGMFVFSPIMGQLADRIGRHRMVVVSAIVLGAGCVLAPLSLMTPWIALALFLVGLGWSGAYVTGSTLLTDALAVNNRTRMQGGNDMLVNIASATGSLSSGVLLQLFGFNILSIIGMGVSLLPVLILLLNGISLRRKQALAA
jgi:MFS family permease